MMSSQKGEALVRKLLPKLEKTMHKGASGKVGVVGGSKDYTGAPYYAATASLRAGADMSHVFCMDEAALPLKCYSPEMIVHPFLGKDGSDLKLWLKTTFTAVVIGPGLGKTHI